MRPALLVVLICGCGGAPSPSSSSEAEVTVDAGSPDAGCVMTDYYHPPADCARPTYCDDGNQCPPHIGFRCSSTGVCTDSAARCADLDAGAAIACH